MYFLSHGGAAAHGMEKAAQLDTLRLESLCCLAIWQKQVTESARLNFLIAKWE